MDLFANIKKQFSIRGWCLVVVTSFCVFLFLQLHATEPKERFENHMGMEFVLIQPGSFVMGSPGDEPYRDENEIQHKVAIQKAFYMQTTEVTIKQWKNVVGRKLFRPRKGLDNIPVTRVSYFQVIKFIKKLNKKEKMRFRLPTEAEWEYACRAGTTTAYSFGDTINCSKAIFANNTEKGPECVKYAKSKGFKPNGPFPVKSYAPNAWGLYDMHGNVWEWCSDKYTVYKDESGRALAGTYPEKNVMIRRGGSWYRYGFYCRSANRAFASPASKFRTTGFRLVLEVD
ncbi:MAG: formylglycine-generating enzyme family protein [Desulfobacteraceae bacterium]|nr:formylglycine-generating enzyme family protein [Desulfobacteraceae bacterium]